MLLTKHQKRRRVRLFLLMAEINALKKCMIEEYEKSGSLRDPILIQLSEILDRKLNDLRQAQK
ncbi:Spo0E family sporulation regulatory protein-aspartic acid phosphatase [Paenibacillus radicis (ex Xue et al. 2023)]|uniref:Spo0E family sporulation regulatory protein-aspartic acid phosphatase n=1 Tax=Paenibacillus radicis (ex Xue et al. 2023) TaxID=2972489 RepID=A0ABT1Y9J8_9BACL|nr:Spo0E family sporulation regulatory protein-aspartic acid phosphatase [Paenibacillus radicis (ex Xue et al. 2023)]MCR8629853.1 Spo0E family sporulation regulatory protein-aspartic acid phosphatase [Paenibacillus radicis (ex Xue et al. 2023)]